MATEEIREQSVSDIAQKKISDKEAKFQEQQRILLEQQEAERKRIEEEKRRKKLAKDKERRQLIPPITMLAAGAGFAILMLVRGFDNYSSLKYLLAVLFGFYIVGCLIQFMFDRFAKQNNPEKTPEEGEVIDKTEGSTKEQ